METTSTIRPRLRGNMSNPFAVAYPRALLSMDAAYTKASIRALKTMHYLLATVCSAPEQNSWTISLSALAAFLRAGEDKAIKPVHARAAFESACEIEAEFGMLGLDDSNGWVGYSSLFDIETIDAKSATFGLVGLIAAEIKNPSRWAYISLNEISRCRSVYGVRMVELASLFRARAAWIGGEYIWSAPAATVAAVMGYHRPGKAVAPSNVISEAIKPAMADTHGVWVDVITGTQHRGRGHLAKVEIHFTPAVERSVVGIMSYTPAGRIDRKVARAFALKDADSYQVKMRAWMALNDALGLGLSDSTAINLHRSWLIALERALACQHQQLADDLASMSPTEAAVTEILRQHQSGGLIYQGGNEQLRREADKAEAARRRRLGWHVPSVLEHDRKPEAEAAPTAPKKKAAYDDGSTPPKGWGANWLNMTTAERIVVEHAAEARPEDKALWASLDQLAIGALFRATANRHVPMWEISSDLEQLAPAAGMEFEAVVARVVEVYGHHRRGASVLALV